MARATNKLTDTFLRRGKLGAGVHGDGGGLYLRVQGDNRSWVYIYAGAGGKRREMGLGAYPTVGLKDARELRDGAVALRVKGIDPIEARAQDRQAAAEAAVVPVAAAVITFGFVCEQFIRAKEAGWTHDIRTRYSGYVKNHLAEIAGVEAALIDTARVAGVLRPLWNTPTGPFLRSFIERALTFAMHSGLIAERLNPARPDAIASVMHDRAHTTRHHDALPYDRVPHCMTGARGIEGMASLAFRFMVLTATRQRETREATWKEIDLDAALWTIPAERYKTRIDHRIPLAPEAVALLESIKSNRDPDSLVFIGYRRARPLSQHAFAGILADLEVDAKPHGFRTSFVGWATKVGKFSDDLAQRCLGHLVGTEVTRAYDRDDRLDERRVMHDEWARYVLTTNT
ncbi:tyrosine-type recombinase/integrase [Mesorhizobium yinganensis]|uniref:tyrosine-type recombinase/integrase n=1 Tax=Mesorhizobium yinganensis TaxID=3157707 RepID=UPI0032B71617